jgi:GT2 family glycosyltransferase
MRPLTVAVTTYQRRDSVVRLVRGLGAQAQATPEAWEDAEILVVVDGSTDGTAEALAELDTPVLLRVHSQPNGGLAAGRNAALARAEGEVVYFLDDDLLPDTGTVARHRAYHEDASGDVLLGPCIIPDEIIVSHGIREWWDQRYQELGDSGKVTRFDQFSIANASSPVSVLRAAGGFDDRFVGYGFEDYELGLRVLATGAEERFDPKAVAWHYTDTNRELAVYRNREIGRNTVRLVQMHPEILDSYFPNGYPGRSSWLLDHLPFHSPRLLAGLSQIAERLAGPAERLSPRLREVDRLASQASYAAGIADLDPTLLPLALGRPRPPRAIG